MYDRLDYQWASSLLAFIALACCAIPFVLYFKGAVIRNHSRYAYAPTPEEEDAMERHAEQTRRKLEAREVESNF
jgi:hypothetical protein